MSARAEALLAGVAAAVLLGLAPAHAQQAQMPMLPQVQPQPNGFGGGMPLAPAQQPGPVGMPRPMPASMPAGLGMGSGMGAPLPPAPQQIVPARPGQTDKADTSGAAPLPKMGPGGFGAMPATPGKEDVAERMNLSGAGDYVSTLTGAANAQLGNMVQGAVPSLDAPTIANQTDLQDLEVVQRQIQLLDSKQKLAEIAVKYWGTVYDNEHAKAWRAEEKKDKEEADKAKEKMVSDDEKRAQLAALLNPQGQAAKPGAGAPNAPGAVKMLAPMVPPPLVYEVVNGKASLIVNGGVVHNARAGTKLPDGSVVRAVDGGNVQATVNGKVVSLGYYAAPMGTGH